MKKHTSGLKALLPALMLSVLLSSCVSTGNDASNVSFQPYHPQKASDTDPQLQVARDAYNRGDYVKTMDTLIELADGGNANAMFSLGSMYEHGDGIHPDLQQAVNYYQKAIQLGNQDAQFNLALMYLNGKGVAKDEAKAFDMLKQLADQGNAEAMYKVSQMILGGIGTQTKLQPALDYLKRSYQKGYAPAASALGYLYLIGNSV
ncbi:MAG: hypothetical protein Q4D76_19350, partial [Oscillospiraceae bacterium]|nr:hypothetical protein [Oscillospiraceae bacterium]